MATRTNTDGDGRRETWDGAAGTYTAWDPDGKQVESRPLTVSEKTDLATLDAHVVVDSAVETLGGLIQQALTDNAAFLALTAPGQPTPSLADLTAQVRRLTRQSQATARYMGTVIPRPGKHFFLDTVTDATTT